MKRSAHRSKGWSALGRHIASLRADSVSWPTSSIATGSGVRVPPAAPSLLAAMTARHRPDAASQNRIEPSEAEDRSSLPSSKRAAMRARSSRASSHGNGAADGSAAAGAGAADSFAAVGADAADKAMRVEGTRVLTQAISQSASHPHRQPRIAHGSPSVVGKAEDGRGPEAGASRVREGRVASDHARQESRNQATAPRTDRTDSSAGRCDRSRGRART